MVNLGKPVDKSNGIFDHNLELIAIWAADDTRPWAVYDANPSWHFLEGGSYRSGR